MTSFTMPDTQTSDRLCVTYGKWCQCFFGI